MKMQKILIMPVSSFRQTLLGNKNMDFTNHQSKIQSAFYMAYKDIAKQSIAYDEEN